jgi:Predicted hydrolase of the alpha/beta superfamily
VSRPLPTESALLRGHAGNIEALIDSPETVKGIALVCHPHPLFGGANTNKVAHTLARAYRDLGYAVIRPNFAAWARAKASTTTARARPRTCCR